MTAGGGYRSRGDDGARSNDMSRGDRQQESPRVERRSDSSGGGDRFEISPPIVRERGASIADGPAEESVQLPRLRPPRPRRRLVEMAAVECGGGGGAPVRSEGARGGGGGGGGGPRGGGESRGGGGRGR